MKVLVTANEVPYISGGAEFHVENLVANLKKKGIQASALKFPFNAGSANAIESMMEYCQNYNCEHLNGIKIDKVISLQFPVYGVQHSNHSIWVMHQHRAVYELYDENRATPADKSLKNSVEKFDAQVLGEKDSLFANSCRVAERLKTYNGLTAEPLYHPPNNADQFFSAESWDYIFYPSRLESLKRQELLIRAAAHLTTPVKILIAGDGSLRDYYARLIRELNLDERVVLLGRITEAEKLTCYAHSLGVFFGPFDEDYGYITLESMLSGKPVITCTDSGGPLEFVRHDENGFVVEPEPEQVAEKIDWLWLNKHKSEEMGREGLAGYHKANIAWDNVLERLLD
ncbi:glycosyltransferase family 4 protein [Neptuniibacter sp.]|uniref:glycosyltransferase family 4 protein n=1 Tax=Neptuniibacter sp. TaxID=1962643 RepID=UPI0026296B2B|nr:glycosyltransferase family 4 protein [Neptuniibacter sp.]MCP4598625.1 glycosyltransferase family 4 protein [Neptuniibacter sp.]